MSEQSSRSWWVDYDSKTMNACSLIVLLDTETNHKRPTIILGFWWFPFILFTTCILYFFNPKYSFSFTRHCTCTCVLLTNKQQLGNESVLWIYKILWKRSVHDDLLLLNWSREVIRIKSLIISGKMLSLALHCNL